MDFKYERLTLFCYLCGLHGHGDHTCEKLFQMEEDDEVRKWGPEIKVDKRRGGTRSTNRWLCEEVGEHNDDTRRAPAEPQKHSMNSNIHIQQTRTLIPVESAMGRPLTHGSNARNADINHNISQVPIVITPIIESHAINSHIIQIIENGS
jgi:hypothetical protein